MPTRACEAACTTTIIDTVSLDELEAFPRRRWFQRTESPNAPAGLDEIAEENDPSARKNSDPPILRGARGRRKGSAIDHDVPADGQRLRFLAYFELFSRPPPRGSANRGNRTSAAQGATGKWCRRVLREEGLPQDLIYLLAQAESAFPAAGRVSKAGARGHVAIHVLLLDGNTALQKTWWGGRARQDPERATRASRTRSARTCTISSATGYLAMARLQFRRGLLVQHAVERTGYGRFLGALHRNVLPKETQNYVPIILALTLISKDPGAIWDRIRRARARA